MLRSAEQAGKAGIEQKRNPAQIQPEDFFRQSDALRSTFGDLIGCVNGDDVAIIPSVSYGLMNAIKNVPPSSGDHIIVVADEFPSGQFAALRWCDNHHKKLVIVKPDEKNNRAESWNKKIISAIDENTAMVLMSSIHWADGTKFDLKTIGEKCQQTDTYFIVDGSQSVGALPLHVHDFNIDALVCAAYKWLFGPYSIGMAYYGNKFLEGTPIEESWMNREHAEDFSNLTNYSERYKSGAARYNVGETSNFIHTPIALAGLKQILDWGVENIQNYCHQLTQLLVEQLRENGYMIEEDHYRCAHLFGLRLPSHMNMNDVLAALKNNNIIVSARGNSIRISPHVYNTKDDIDKLAEVLL